MDKTFPLLFCFLSTAGIAQEGVMNSMMLSPAELEAIGAISPAILSPDQQQDLHLDGIIYTSSDDWTVWINRVAYTPRHQTASFKILKVRPTEVDIEQQRNNGKKNADVKDLNRAIQIASENYLKTASYLNEKFPMPTVQGHKIPLIAFDLLKASCNN